MEANPRSLEFAPTEPQESGWAALAFAWRRKGLVLLFLIVAGGLGYLYFLRQEPLYQSSAQILIVENQPRLPIQGVEVRTSSEEMHVSLLRSQTVMEKAVERGGLSGLATIGASGSPAARVMSGLSVSGGGTRTGALLQLSYKSTSREDCPKVLQAVVDAYQAFLEDMYEDVSAETIDLIEQAKEQLDQQITEKEAELRKMLDESPLLVTGETARNIHEMRLEKIEAARSASVLENSRLQAKIDAIQASLNRGSSREALNLLVGHIERFGAQAVANATGQDQLFPLLLQKEILLENHGPDHPKVQSIVKRIEFTRNHLELNRPKQPEPDEEPAKVDYYQIYLESLNEQIKMNEQTLTEMTRLFEEERKAAKSLSTYKVTEETYRSEIERKSRLFDVVLKRLEEISLVKGRGGAEVQVIHPPSSGYQVQPDFKSTMATSIVLGLLCGLGLAFVVDAADRRFRTPDEIRSDLGVPVVGHIPVIPGTAKRRTPQSIEAELRTIHAPRGRIAEAYRAVRTAIYFSTRGAGHQVIQVTSPNPGDGKTTLAANLAVSIAHSGKKVLLIDGDFRRPRCHQIFGLDNDAGMSSVIEGGAEWTDAVQSTEVDNLSVLPCGPKPDQPSELLTSRRFEELIALFRDRYELVIIDTPPVMAVTDPLTVAPRVDSVLVVLRLTKSARNAASRTLAALDEIGAKVLGVVVNGIGHGERYVSSYAQYGYGQGYGGYSYDSRYGYHYGYADPSYYTEEPEQTPKAIARNGNGSR